MKKNIDIAIVVPLEEEYEAFQSVFPRVCEVSSSPFIEEVDLGHPEISAVAAVQNGMGKTYAEQAVGAILEAYEPRIFICLGIAGGLSGDLKLGDVCYTNRVVDVYDNSKVSDVDDKIDLQFSPTFYSTPENITCALDLLRRRREFKPLYNAWRSEREKYYLEQGNNNPGITEGGPATLCGTIACGAVSASASYNGKLKEIDRKILAVDTESGAIFERAKRAGIPAISIRGISDMANKEKSKLEATSGGSARRYAALNAANFLKFSVQTSPEFRDSIKGSGGQKTLNLSNQPTARPTFHSHVSDVRKCIQQRLAELSAEYKLLPKGYILPLPRVKKVTAQLPSDSRKAGSAIEIIDAIRQNARVFISISQSYPEKSLSWVISEELSRSEISGSQVLPIVVAGRDVKPPSSSIESVALTPSMPDIGREDYVPVIVFDGVPLNSKSRMKFIAAQVAIHPESRFIFVDRTPSNIVFENEFISQTGCEIFELCDISFAQMSYFVQKNFDMTSAEANVVARRLNDTFRKFQLSAHPSYFAGIPQSTLTALIQANQRAELMELAVAGFLSFVVADDKAPVLLSRTTRERFLKVLAMDLNIEKKSMDESKLIQYTKDFAALHDFDIDALGFLKGFVDHNILNFFGGHVQFSLPFMEHYLLAKALSGAPDKASNYFGGSNLELDISTFDLYCEINPSKQIVGERVKLLRNALSEVAGSGENGGKLIASKEVDYVLSKHKPKAETIANRIAQAIEDVKAGKDETSEKQMLLDAADRVSEEYGKNRQRTQNNRANESDLDEIGKIALNWTMCVVLLGSGSEHLDAKTKRDVIGLLLEGADILIEDFLKFAMAAPFDRIKKDLTAPASLESFARRFEADISKDRLKIMLEDIVDSMRFMTLIMPFRQVIGYLCEHARQPVLAKSLADTLPNSAVRNIYHAIWLSDIDSNTGKRFLSAEIKRLGGAKFLRVCMASHFLERVYWSQASKSNRLNMLEMAEESIKTTSFAFEKGALERLINRDAKLDIDLERPDDA